jgi:uncharacterized membrane protein YhaH (DUF805 family)
LAGSPAGPDRALPAAVLVGIVALAVYRTTLLPGLGAWDTAEAQAVLPLLGTMHPTGFPAFVLLGWVASIVLRPLGEPAFIENLLAAALVATAAGGSVLVVRRLGAPTPIAAAAGIGLALTPVAWHLSTAADAHALHLALLVLLALALLRWADRVAERDAAEAEAAADDHAGVDPAPDGPRLRARADRALLLAAAIGGIAVANHGLALLLVPPVGLYALAVDRGLRRRPRALLAPIATALAVAGALYLELPIRAGLLRGPLVYGHPETLGGFLDVAFGRQFSGGLGAPLADPGATLASVASLVAGQLGPLALFALVGLAVTARRRPAWALLSGTAAGITVVFAATYPNADIGRYYAGPAFFAWTWLGVLAGAVAERLLRREATDDDDGGGGADPDPEVVLPGHRIVPASTLVAGLVGLALLVPTAAVLDLRWRAADRSGERWEVQWVDDAFTTMAPDAAVVSWWSYSTPMWYAQLVEGRRQDLRIIDDRMLVDDNLGSAADAIDALLGTRPVYVIRATVSDLQALEQRFAIEPVGRPAELYRVTGRLETGP